MRSNASHKTPWSTRRGAEAFGPKYSILLAVGHPILITSS